MESPASDVLPPWMAEWLQRGRRLWRDARGQWWDGEQRVTHPGLARALDGWVDRAPDGEWCLRNALGWVPVRIDGPPYRVVSVALQAEPVVLTLSGGRREPLEPETLRLGPHEDLWCTVLPSRLPARFERAPAYALLERFGEEREGRLGVRIGGRFYPLPRLDEPMRVS